MPYIIRSQANICEAIYYLSFVMALWTLAAGPAAAIVRDVLSSGVLFFVSGLIMWFFKDIVSTGIFQWCVIVHDVALLLAFLMLLVHIYLGIIHPRMTESLRSTWSGKISKAYAKSHYGRWYEEISSSEK